MLELTSSPEPEEKNEPGSIDIFTPRERDCLRLLLAGKSNKQIARALGISIRTVDNHVDNMLRKTGTNSRLELFSQIKTASLAALIA